MFCNHFFYFSQSSANFITLLATFITLLFYSELRIYDLQLALIPGSLRVLLVQFTGWFNLQKNSRLQWLFLTYFMIHIGSL
jgi:hypothetical protein